MAEMGIREIPELVFEKLQANFAHAPEWLPKIVEDAIRRLGPLGMQRMRSAIAPNRYTGELSNSIITDYGKAEGSSHNFQVSIFPEAMRGGRWDAGLLLELGVPHPIPNLPYAPIAAWAAFRGAPMPQVWLGIRAHGVKAHPFLDNSLENVMPDVEIEQTRILDEMIEKVLEGTAPE
jgi:hypothetical protein